MSTDLFNEHFKDNYFLQSVIDSIEEGVIVQNREGTIIGFNSKALEILSLNEKELFGKTSYDNMWNACLEDGIIASGDEHPISVTLQTGQPQTNVLMQVNVFNRGARWINVNSKLFHIGDDVFAFANFSDVTDMVQTNQSLTLEKQQRKISEKKFSNVFKYSSIGKAILSPEGNIMDVNDALCNMLGYTKEELFSNGLKEICHESDYAENILQTKQMLITELKKVEQEMRFIKKDGSLCWATVTSSLVRDDARNPQFFISQIQEITALKQLNKNLETQNRELLKTQMALEKKVSQLKEFAGIITHDVRGPAHNIRKMLEMYEVTEDPELKQASLDYLKKVSADLTNNLNELVQILQIQMEKDIPNSDCSFEEIISSVCLQLQETINRKKAVIHTDLKVSTLMYPRVFLQSIVYNLLSNSLKYVQPDQPPVIEIKTFKDAGNICLTVKDYGLGIDMKRFGHMLFRFQKSFHSGFDSKGIGLYLIKSQIEDQGGTISAESEPNKGITFTVRF
ncbi:MAG TPA: PAS domain S-box protein [Sediminibacterium sp.]|nr:PAS domain S-box protein [Sediminibacterium sp.]